MVLLDKYCNGTNLLKQTVTSIYIPNNGLQSIQPNNSFLLSQQLQWTFSSFLQIELCLVHKNCMTFRINTDNVQNSMTTLFVQFLFSLFSFLDILVYWSKLPIQHGFLRTLFLFLYLSNFFSTIIQIWLRWPKQCFATHGRARVFRRKQEIMLHV